MAKNVTIAGASFSAVPSIDVPQTGGGTASFFDVSDTTATAADVAQGKVFYASDGTLTTGTASGGGASNIVTGTFTTITARGNQTITVPYNGNGFPVAILVYFAGDMYDANYERYTSFVMTLVKSNTSPPSYTGEDYNDYAMTTNSYKSTAVGEYTIMRGGQWAAMYSQAGPPTNANAAPRINSATTFTVRVKNQTTYGLMQGTVYNYVVIYSE